MWQQKWFSLGRDAADDIATHIAKIKDIACRLTAFGEPVPNSMVITKILLTLPPSLKHFATAWELTGQDQRTLTNLISSLSMEEIRAAADEGTDNKAFSPNTEQQKFSKGKSEKKPGECYNCGRPGYWKNECRSTKKVSKQDEPGADGEGRGSAFVGSIVAAHTVLSEEHLEKWFMDSGASLHMSPRRDWFVNYKKLPTPTQVRVGNGEVILAQGFGEINILSFDGSQWERNHLTPVLYVPDLKYNLFSMSSSKMPTAQE